MVARGNKLEMLINMVNNEYRNADVAVINKVPPPLKVGKVKGKNVSAYLDKACWLDYTGIYKGYSLIFDAKESTLERFPLANLAAHQYETMKSWDRHGAVAFLIVAFWLKGKNEPEIYYLSYKQLASFWETKDLQRGSKSIPIKYFRENCIRVECRNGYTLHYLLALGLSQLGERDEKRS